MNRQSTLAERMLQYIADRGTRPVVFLLLSLFVLTAVAARAPQDAASASTSGTIAYVRNTNEIRLIEPDGSNDRRLWIEPRLDVSYTINSLAWRPDATELTFASTHEESCSIYESDIYGIKPDGSGLRRITNAPACAALASYPKGNVTVTVANVSADSGPFFVYVQGAPGVQMVIVPPGSASAVTFNGVADFGSGLQEIVAIDGEYRWLDPSAAVNVTAGQTVNAGTFTLSGGGFRHYGADAPAWRRDGSQLGFILKDCALMEKVPANPPAGDSGTEILSTLSAFPCLMDWGPTPALANQILYYSYLGDNAFYQVTEGSSTVGTKLVSVPDPEVAYDMQWLPDGSGFLFTMSTDYDVSVNLYEYNLASRVVTPRTSFSDEFVRNFAISPDGQTIVFERAAALDASTADLWLKPRAGTQMSLLVPNGRLPAWSWNSPSALNRKLYLPLIVR